MEDFKVTRDMVHELAETGSVQPPMKIWQNLGSLYENMGQIGHRKFSVTRDFEEFTKTEKGAVILPTARDIIRLSGETDLEWDIAREMGYTLQQEDCGWHPDPDSSSGGFSVLFVKKPAKDECLVTGGRGEVRSRTNIKVHYYKNGPIILAQDRFGHRLLRPDQDRLGVWHTGVRLEPSRFGVVDFIPSNSTKQA